MSKDKKVTPEQMNQALARVLIAEGAVPGAKNMEEVSSRFQTFLEKMPQERIAVALRGLVNIETGLMDDLYSDLDKKVVDSKLYDPKAGEDAIDELVSALNDHLDKATTDINVTLEDIFYPSEHNAV